VQAVVCIASLYALARDHAGRLPSVAAVDSAVYGVSCFVSGRFRDLLCAPAR
jgi:hypothetical protein